jgi:hypothetical protein
MRICAIVDWVNPVFADALQALAEQGDQADLLRSEAQRIDLAAVREEYDLYLLKSGTDLALSLAGALHAAGAATLNPYPTVALMRNKFGSYVGVPDAPRRLADYIHAASRRPVQGEPISPVLSQYPCNG